MGKDVDVSFNIKSPYADSIPQSCFGPVAVSSDDVVVGRDAVLRDDRLIPIAK